MNFESRGSIKFIIAFAVIAGIFILYLITSNMTCDSSIEGGCAKERTMLAVFAPLCLIGILGAVYFVKKLKNESDL